LFSVLLLTPPPKSASSPSSHCHCCCCCCCCPPCSPRCWDALTCSACASIAAWSTSAPTPSSTSLPHSLPLILIHALLWQWLSCCSCCCYGCHVLLRHKHREQGTSALPALLPHACCLTLLCLVPSAFVAHYFYDTRDAASRCFALSQAPL